MESTAGIQEIHRNGKIIFIIDYSDLREAEMIALALDLKQRILNRHEMVLMISVFNDRSFITPGFLRTVEREIIDLLPRIEKQAIAGLNNIKKMILKGYNLYVGRNIPCFDSVDEAINFVLDETTTDK